MRNLKRALSLALAAIMLIGMMVVSASAAGFDDFSDKDEIVNKDAVSMLTILGVINGKEDGSFFDPAGNVTRAEMAKMIATVLNQGADVDGLYVGMNTGLTDVKGHWAESYINYCYSLGIIAGRGNGKFDPAATVTGNEAAKMLLVAAGYDAQLEGLTGNDWAIKTASLASTLGIFDDLTAPTGDPLTRDNAALLIYNALDIEMIQKYENGYAIAFGDHRTLLSTKYGVYKVEGVVTGNEWAQLEDTDSEDALAAGKTKMDHVKVYKSTTSNTVVGEYETEKNPVIFNVSTPVDMLGQTVTMYVRKTTVLANSEVLGVYVNGNNNVVKTTADTQDTMKDFLKGTGLSVDGDTAYYVNYGVMKDEAAATKAMGFESGDRFNSVKGKTNGYGVELTAIDNDNDGEVEYVLYLQETLSQVIAKSASKETTTLNTFNSNKAIDNEDIVTEADLAEGDLVLTVSYGGRYYVSEPQVITGQMESYAANKEKEQTITVGGTEYHPSYIQYKADTADNTYEFDVLKCDNGGVEFDSDYDFILDSNGNVIAYRPSEQGLYDYALVLDSGYEPGAFASDASGKIKVLLADGTEGVYTLNFSASAKNVGEQVAGAVSSTTYSKNQGIQELKGFLGTSDSDNSATAPWQTAISGAGAFAHKDIDASGGNPNAADYKDGRAAGYVIAYSLNDDNVLTIKSIVGSNDEVSVVTSVFNPADVKQQTMSSAYETGAARIRYNSNNSQITVDKNTVAFYYDNSTPSDITYGVAVGYNKMAHVDNNKIVSARFLDSKSTLASTVLFDAKGVAVEKDYAFVLSRSSVDSKYATLNVVLMDGTVTTLKITRSDYNSIFSTSNDFSIPYAYTTDGNGVSDLTKPNFSSDGNQASNLEIVRGYARQLRTGTVALYTNKTMTNLVNGTYGDGTFTYENNIWNVEDVDNSYEKAPVGSFSENVGREVVMVIDSDKNIVRAAYILSTLDGVYAGQISVATAAETGVNTNSTKLATATVTKPAGGTGALTYEWFKCDDAAGSKPVSLKNDANYTVSSSGVTSVLNVKAGVLTAGDHYFKVVATYTETGKVATTADGVVKVTVAAAPAAGSLSISNTDLITPTVMKNGTPATAAAGTSLYLGFSEGDKVQIVSSDIKANSYWKVAGTVYQASGAGILSFTMPKTDLTIAKADQQVKYTLGKGVSLTGTGYDAATGYAPVGTAVTITVAPANGTGVLVSNDGTLKSAAVGTTVGSAIATAGTFTPTNAESDVYMNAASILTFSAGTGTAPTAKLTNGGTALTSGHYVATGLNVTLTCGTNNETITWTVTSLTVGNGITEVTAPGAAAAGVYTFDMPATGLTATENT
ncbi:MAG: S-layer homology domain-containing protein [Flavonifractor plautii]|nr:MAG: S-layer homology domain-containing protein [Flavonifractor plautii]